MHFIKLVTCVKCLQLLHNKHFPRLYSFPESQDFRNIFILGQICVSKLVSGTLAGGELLNRISAL